MGHIGNIFPHPLLTTSKVRPGNRSRIGGVERLPSHLYALGGMSCTGLHLSSSLNSIDGVLLAML